MVNNVADGPSGESGGWRAEYTSPSGDIKLVVDEEAYDWHIDARLDYDPVEMRRVIKEATWGGLVLLDDDECLPEILDDDTIRIYLCPTPVSMAPKLEVVA